MEAQNNPYCNDDAQEEPKKKKERAMSGSKKKSLLDGEEIVRGTPVKDCCCHPITISLLTLIALVLICAGVISGFIVADIIKKANEDRTPCTDKRTGNMCTMVDGGEGVCALEDDKFFNDGELICDDVTPYEKACQQKDSDDECLVDGIDEAGECMYTSTDSKALWCNIPTKAELACLTFSRKPKETGSECEMQVGEATEKGKCQVVVYASRKQCIIPDPDEEICASMTRANGCTTSKGKKGSCEQMMDNQLKCVENQPVQTDFRIVAVAAIGTGLILLGVTVFGIFCYCRQQKS